MLPGVRYLLLTAALLAAGCKAHMLETRGDKVMLLAPKDAKPGKGGVIRYLQTGPKSFQAARKSDAEAQMRRFCGGEYRVSAEGPRSKLGASVPVKSSFEMDEYWYVVFDCAEG